MTEYQRRVFEARKQFISLNIEQEKELYNIYKSSGDKLIDKILQMPDSRTKNHEIERYKIIAQYKEEIYTKLNKTIENNIKKSSDIQKGVQLSFVDMISPDKVTNEALTRTITKVSNDTVKQLIAGNYYKDGKTLSNRLWNIAGNNANKIDEIIKDNIAKGSNVRELAKELDKYVNPKNRITAKSFKAGMDSNKISYQAQRLARTSIAHAQTETLIQNAKKNPFCKGLKWNLSASHFERMHGKMDICDNLNGRIFKPEELPLQHPNCLCYMTEVLEEFDKCIETMKDWKNGKQTPKNKDIDDWVEDGQENTSLKISASDKIQTKMDIDSTQTKVLYNINNNNIAASTKNNAINMSENMSEDSVDIKDFINKILGKEEKVTNVKLKLSELPKEDYENILNIVSEAPVQFQNKVLKIADKIIFLDLDEKKRNRYSPKDGGIYYNLDNDKNNLHGKGKYSTIFHEIGHLLDKNMGRPSIKSDVFKSLIIEDANKFIESSKTKVNVVYDNEIYDIIKTELEIDNRYHSVADIFGGVTNNRIVHCRFGHDDEYWEKEGSLERETFAHFFEATIRNDKFKLDNFKNIFPNAYKEFMRMMKEG